MRVRNKEISKSLIGNREGDKNNLFNRELSFLSFNYRVLEESCREKVPLLEKVNFLSISASNLDEFYMIRVAGLKDQIRSGKGNNITDDGLSLNEQDSLIKKSVNSFLDKQNKCWFNIKNKLSKERIDIVTIESILEEEKNFLNSYFKNKVFPILTPLAIDPAHSFPFIPNLGLSIILELKELNTRNKMDALVPIPQSLPRFIRVSDSSERYLSIEDLIVMFADYLFPSFQVSHSGLFRVIRDSEMEVDDEGQNLLQSFETALKKRRRGVCINLTFSSSTSEKQVKMIFDTVPNM